MKPSDLAEELRRHARNDAMHPNYLLPGEHRLNEAAALIDALEAEVLALRSENAALRRARPIFSMRDDPLHGAVQLGFAWMLTHEEIDNIPPGLLAEYATSRFRESLGGCLTSLAAGEKGDS